MAGLAAPVLGWSVDTLYAGLTKVLDLRERNDRFWLDVHPTHATAGSFDPTWRVPRCSDDLAAVVPGVVGYLDRVMAPGVVDPRHSSREGRLQTLIGTAQGQPFAVFQREAVPSFVSQSVKDAVRAPFMERMIEALRLAPQRPGWWPGVRDRGADPSFGPELDAIALDSAGRLLTIEIKPADAVQGIAWAPGQARCYAELFALWLEVDPQARESILNMSAQRRRLGLAAPPAEWELPVQTKIRVVPVIAIGAGKLSSEALSRLLMVHEALQELPSQSARLEPLEVWWVGVRRRRSAAGVATGRGTGTKVVVMPAGLESDQSYRVAARRAALAWKVSTATLPDEARLPGQYKAWASLPFCLPLQHSTFNLLPEARVCALERFTAAGIAWHDGVGDGPSNHLLDSQVNFARPTPNAASTTPASHSEERSIQRLADSPTR